MAEQEADILANHWWNMDRWDYRCNDCDAHGEGDRNKDAATAHARDNEGHTVTVRHRVVDTYDIHSGPPAGPPMPAVSNVD